MNSLVRFGQSFELLSSIKNEIFLRNHHKKYVFVIFGLISFEIIFTLLIKIIEFHIKIIIKEV